MGKKLDCRARITSKELAPLQSVKSGILQNACSTSRSMDAELEKIALTHTARLNNSLAKGPHSPARRLKRMVTKCSLFLKNTRQMGCVFQDMEQPKSSSVLRKSSDIRRPIRRVLFTKAVLRHANIRDQNPSLGMICPGDPHQRNPQRPKI